MDQQFRQAQLAFRKSPDDYTIGAYWAASIRTGTIPIEFLCTAVRCIQMKINEEFVDAYWPLARRHGLINNMDWRTPESSKKSIEKWIVEDTPFHLGPCICGAPGWQQPCPFCGYWPDHGMYQRERERYDNRFLNTFNRDKFTQTLSRFEDNIALLWATNRYAGDPPRSLIARRTQELVRQWNWPSSAQVWDAYEKRSCRVNQSHPRWRTLQLTSVYVPGDLLSLPLRSTPIAYRVEYCAEHARQLGFNVSDFEVLAWPPVR